MPGSGRSEYRGRSGPPAPAPARKTIERKVPEGSDRITGTRIERLYVDDMVADPRWRALRPHARRNMLEWAKWMARSADYATGTTRPTRLAICRLARFCIRTFQRCRARAQAWGRLGVVREGMCLADWPDANEAAVYVLCIPRKIRPKLESAQLSPQTVAPTGERSCSVEVSPHDRRQKQGQEPDRAPSGRAVSPEVARAVRKGPAKDISDRAVAVLTRPFRAAGWSPAALSWAVDHERDGTWHFRSLTEVRRPAGWLKWRLGRHLGDAGVPLASSLGLALAHDQQPPPFADRQSAAAPPTAEWLRARAALEERRRS